MIRLCAEGLRLSPRARFARALLVAVLLLSSFVLAAAVGTASAAEQTISSAGPLTNVRLRDDLACQVNHAGDVANEFYGGEACGTFLWVGGEQTTENVYGPNVAAGASRLQYTPVSQTSVTGSGTSAEPYKVVTVVDAGSTGLGITQTDSYVVGNEFYRSDIQVTNSTSSDLTASLYHAGDCYLQESDAGFGWIDPVGGGIYCTKNANNSPVGRIEGFVPLSSGTNFTEISWPTIWSVIDGTQLANTCDCENLEDNGAGLSWSITVPAHGSVTRSLLSNFSPAGSTPTQEPTTLAVKSAAGDFADPATVSATLTNTRTAGPVNGKTVKFTLNGIETCTGTTNTSGEASCSITPKEPAGTYTLEGEFAGDSEFGGSTGSASFEVTKEETGLGYTGPSSAVNGQPATLSGHLTTDDPAAGTGLAGKSVTFTLGEGVGAQTCTGTTDGSGDASCEIASVSQAVGSTPVKASFVGDTFYVAAEATSTVSVFDAHATGAFVVGDLSAGPGATVNFWGAQWAKNNRFSGGAAPSSMKGYASSPTALTCNATWTTSTGNSSAPPATLPSTIDVIVSSKVTQKGSTISGQIARIVVVEVNPGYGPAPGHPGSGKIIGSIC